MKNIPGYPWLFAARLVGAAVIAIVVSGMLTSCHRQDVKMTQLAAGYWQDGAAGEMHLNPEGDFKAKSYLIANNTTNVWRFEGLWQINDGFFIRTITNSFTFNVTNFEPSGSVDRYKVLKLDQTSFVWQDKNEAVYWDRR